MQLFLCYGLYVLVIVWVAEAFPADPGFTLYVVWFAVAFPANQGLLVFWSPMTVGWRCLPRSQDYFILFSLREETVYCLGCWGDPCGPPSCESALILRAELGGACQLLMVFVLPGEYMCRSVRTFI
jgi:hypothetical protein